MKKGLLSTIILLLVLCPAKAHWEQQILPKFKKLSTLSVTSRTLATQRAIHQALKNKKILLSQSVFSLKLADENSHVFPSWDYPLASAFVFEEQYNGKTYLWGATTTHYFLQEPLLENPQTGEEIPIQIVAQGHSGHNDVSLFFIPTPLQNQFKPLSLANHTAQKGETLHSAGYFDDGFHVETSRVVTAILPTRILTSLVVEDKLAREGACGGPVLNKKGEVVGMHAGSSNRQQAGFVIPVEYIHELLDAYHHNGNSLHPFYFNGRKIGEININEHIESIEVWQGDKQIENFIPYPYRAHIDYEHLEKWVDASKADKIIFIINRSPFSAVQQDQHSYQFQITYNLRTHHISNRKRL